MDLIYEIGMCVARADQKLQANAKLMERFRELMPGFKKINWQAGTLDEIGQTLDAMSNSDTARYEKMPLVAMITPYDKIKKGGSDFKTFKGTFFIICPSNEKDRRAERSLKSFEPILHPIADELLRQMTLSTAFHTYGIDQSFRELDHDYWAKQKNKNVFNEYVDAVEIRDLTIPLSISCNCL